MQKSLIVAEKPSVAADIAKTLGGFRKQDGYYEREDAIVAAARGHLVVLCYPQADTKAAWEIDVLPIIPPLFSLEVGSGCSPEFNRIKNLMEREDVGDIVNACDAGREGELIFRLIYRKIESRKPIRRMWIQSMVAAAIQNAYDSARPGSEFDSLHDAAMCRAEADWIVGINGTRAATVLRQRQTDTREVTNVGRVLTPTLAMPVVREREIISFTPSDYWQVVGIFQSGTSSYSGKWVATGAELHCEGEGAASIYDKCQALALIEKCKTQAPDLVTDETTEESRQPPVLFDLTTLQREANKLYKFSAKKTLDLAQSLYETHKAATYPRTDSTSLPEDYVETVRTTMASFTGTPHAAFSEAVLKNGWFRSENKVFDDADISDHFAIVPSGQQPYGLSPDEQTIYDLICRRFIAAFYPSAHYAKSVRITLIAGETFRTTGRVLLERGWLEVYGAVEGEPASPQLCRLEPDGVVTNESIELKELRTKPPKRYTEASLLSAMEHAGRQVEDEVVKAALKTTGLGRPAVRASIIEGLLAHQDSKGNSKEPYLVRLDNELLPTSKAMALIALLEDCGIRSLVSPEMTGQWEQKLLLMEKGEYDRPAFMAEVAEASTNMVYALKGKADTLASQPRRQIGVPCRKCGAAVCINGRAYECLDCGAKLWGEVAGRPLAVAEVETLLRDGQTGVLSGFVSAKTNKKFSAALRLDIESGKTEFVFDNAASAPRADAKELACKCPRCHAPVHAQGKVYQCSKCDFKLWCEVASRTLAVKEMELLITRGETGQLAGFKSSAGRKFSAALKLNRETWKLDFKFAEKKPLTDA